VFFHEEANGLFEDLSLLEELSIFLHLIKQLTLRHIYNSKSDTCASGTLGIDTQSGEEKKKLMSPTLTRRR
jgi:hypothetical protein